MTNDNKAKLRAWKANERQRQAERQAIAKAIRRHKGEKHGFEQWGRLMSMLRAIHNEIDPIIQARRNFFA